ncbi:MAG TPA: PAS domain S-box protein [Gemmatimonadaceae bacterium]|jgi:PAS domain S-box-containing protein
MALEVGPDLYRLLVESVRDYAIFALDAKGNVLTWNAGAERFKGYKPHEIIGRHFSTFYTEEDKAAQKPERELEEATAHGRVEDEGWRIRKDGTRFWANVVITALRDPSGELVGFAKVTRDLSERRAASEALRRSEQRFRLLVQGVRDYGIFMLDPTGHVVSWNEGAARMKGYAAHEILGQHFSKFYPAEDLAWDKPAMEIEVATREGRFEDEGWRVRKDGTRFWANVIITAIIDPSGNLAGFTKVTRDLSERRTADQKALEDARRVALAESANKAKGEFLASMSHELRTPLNAIGGYADLLLAGVTGGLTPTQREYLERMRRSQQHLLAIINDLLNFSRIEAGRVQYDMAEISLRGAMTSVVSMVEALAMQRNLKLDVNLDTDLVVVGDAPKVEQILLNLLSNSIKFTEAGGRITMAAFPDGECAGVRVTDTGVGIPADKLESIFEPFVQVGRTFATSHEGVGLGLAISRDLARAMNGDLTAESTPDVGSSFALTLRRSAK